MNAAASPLAERFSYMVPSFDAGPAPLYAHLAGNAADELARHDSAFRRALEPFEGEPPRRLLPLRLLGVVHRAVLAGELPDLARHYPSAGGRLPPAGSWPLFRDAVVDRTDRLPGLLAFPHQHNEVTRAAALAAGFLSLSARFGMPLRLLEVGASAGLLLRWDQFLDRPWYAAMYEGRPLGCLGLQVVERGGCDLNPIDPTTEEGALTLKSLVWADLAGHIGILDDAIEVARLIPAYVDRRDGAEWLAEKLALRVPGVMTVVYHSLMRGAGPQESLGRIDEALLQAAARADRDAPLAHLRFEAAPDRLDMPLGDARSLVETVLSVWPGAQDELLVTSDVNGRHVRWPG